MIRFTPEAFVSFVLAALLLAGCDRPIVDPIAPDIELVSPDLDAVQTEDSVVLRLAVESISGVDLVRVDGAEATRDDATGLWEIEVRLRPGANTFVLEAFSNDVTATREVDIIQANVEVQATSIGLPEARAGHTATALATGILLAGGTGRSGDVLSSLQILRETSGNTFAFTPQANLLTPRTGHTATVLPDGRVLILGGTSSPEASGAADFVDTPEVFDPETGTTRPVFTRRSRSLRTRHSTLLLSRNDRLYLYVLGGETALGGAPFVGPNDALEIFEFKSSASADTLVTLTPGGGASGGARLAAPSQLLLTTSDTQIVTVLTGLDATTSTPLPFAARLFYTAPGSQYPFGLNQGVAGLPLEPRTSASGVGLGNSLALLTGGRGASGSPLASLEVFADRSGRFLSVPASLVTPRYSHTVTRAPSGRILVIGGRNASGQALSTIEVLTL